MMKVVKLWAGFCDGELQFNEVDMGWGGFNTGDMVTVPALFKTREKARKKYRDVRRVEIHFPTERTS